MQNLLLVRRRVLKPGALRAVLLRLQGGDRPDPGGTGRSGRRLLSVLGVGPAGQQPESVAVQNSQIKTRKDRPTSPDAPEEDLHQADEAGAGDETEGAAKVGHVVGERHPQFPLDLGDRLSCQLHHGRKNCIGTTKSYVPTYTIVHVPSTYCTYLKADISHAL